MELLEDLRNVVAMVGQVPGVNKDVVDIDYHRAVEELPEHLVHKLLEDRGGVGKAIRHNKVFIVAGWSNECRLLLIALPDPNEVVCTAQVQLREDAGPTEFIEHGRDQGKWIGKLNSLGIQSSIINAWPQAPVLLTHKEKA